MRGARSEVRGARSEVRGPRSEVRGPRSEVRGARCEVRGPRFEVRGPRSEVRGARCEVRGPRFEVRGPRSEVRGARFEVRGSRSEVRGPRCEVRGTRCEVRGCTEPTLPLPSSISKFGTKIMFYPDERNVLGDGTKTMRFSNKCSEPKRTIVSFYFTTCRRSSAKKTRTRYETNDSPLAAAIFKVGKADTLSCPKQCAVTVLDAT